MGRDKDFEIFSSYADALARKDPWKYCDYDDPGVGFPRDCGKTGKAPARNYGDRQWNTWSCLGPPRYCGRDVQFYIEPGVCVCALACMTFQ